MGVGGGSGVGVGHLPSTSDGFSSFFSYGLKNK